MAWTDQARTILGSLTTTYTPAPSCTNPVQQCPTCTKAWQAQACWSSNTASFGAEDNPDCWPPRASFVPTTSPLQNGVRGWGFYSPGLICPTGFTSACSATGGGISGWPVQFGLLEKETAVGCCPSGYSCSNNGGPQTCISYASSTSFPMVTCGPEGSSDGAFIFTVPQTIAVVSTVTVTIPEVETLTSTDDVFIGSGTFTETTIVSTIVEATVTGFETSTLTGLGSSSVIPLYSLYAPMIQINFQASDLPSSTSEPTSNPTSAPTSSTNPPSPTNTNTSTTTASPAISSGAKAGIGIGVALGVIALACLSLFFIRNRKKHAYKPTAPHAPKNLSAPNKPDKAEVYELGAANRGPYATAELPFSHQKGDTGTGKAGQEFFEVGGETARVAESG